MFNNLLWVGMGFIGAAAILAVFGIWFPKFWDNGFGAKCMATFAVAAVTAFTWAFVGSYIK